MVERRKTSVFSTLYSWHVMPPHPFANTPIPEPPDYTDHGPRAWSAFPGRKQNSAELRPQGETDYVPESERPVDCFYVNPTSYGVVNGRQHYNAPLDEYHANNGIELCLATQASSFNSMCRIYAPRYRQCTLAGVYYTSGSIDDRMQAMELAYGDVKKAFEHFISQLCVGDRPFIVAAHSQGSRLVVRLLAECVEGTQLVERLVAAYLVGGGLPLSLLERDFKQLKVCQGPLDTGCIIGWDVVPDTFTQSQHFYYTEAGRMHYSAARGQYEVTSAMMDEAWLSVSPLTWRPADQSETQGQGEGKAEHLGVLDFVLGWSLGRMRPLVRKILRVKVDSSFKVKMDGSFVVVSEVTKHVAKGVRLSPFYSAKMLGGTYHFQEFSMFYFNIRANAKERIAAFLQKRGRTAAVQA